MPESGKEERKGGHLYDTVIYPILVVLMEGGAAARLFGLLRDKIVVVAEVGVMRRGPPPSALVAQVGHVECGMWCFAYPCVWGSRCNSSE